MAIFELLTADNLAFVNDWTKGEFKRKYRITAISNQSLLIERVQETIHLADLFNEAKVRNGFAENCKFANQSESLLLKSYFLDRFLNPDVYFERKETFISGYAGVCAGSYIIGLGDRHYYNIKVDSTTCEPFNIDFGYSFFYGLSLNYPELYYFRFTPNIRSSLGPCKGNGFFSTLFAEHLEKISQNIEVMKFLNFPLISKNIFAAVFPDASKVYYEAFSKIKDNLFTQFDKLAVDLRFAESEKYVKFLLQNQADESTYDKMYVNWRSFN